MAYTSIELNSLAGRVKARYSDQNLKQNRQLPTKLNRKIVALGTAAKGVRNALYDVDNARTVSRDFGEKTELFDATSAITVLNEADFNLSLLRIGSKPHHWRVTKLINSTDEETELLISIIPREVEEKTLENLRIILLPFKEGNAIRQRIILVNIQDSSNPVIVYDSERILVEGGELLFEVEINMPLGIILYSDSSHTSNKITGSQTAATLSSNIGEISKLRSFNLGSCITLATARSSIADLSVVDINARTVQGTFTTATLSGGFTLSVGTITGSVQDNLNHCERYAHVEIAYNELEDANPEFLYCEGCFADIEPVVLSGSTNKDISWHNDKLGYLWKYEYNNESYMFMFGRKDPFKHTNIKETYTTTNIAGGALSIDFNHSTYGKDLGDLLNLVEVTLDCKDNATLKVENWVDHTGIIKCHVTGDFDSAGSGTAVEVITPFGYMNIDTDIADATSKTFRLRPSLDGDGTVAGVGTTNNLSAYLINNGVTTMDPFAISHFELVGESVPAAVMSKLITFQESSNGTGAGDNKTEAAVLRAKDVEVREISFLQQAGQAAYKSSINYNSVVAVIPTTNPKASNRGIGVWAGNFPTFKINDDGTVVVDQNGNGLLGNKFLTGNTDYRSGEAFGGIYLTKGDDLPNAKPYGVLFSDEALDIDEKLIDLGKHVILSGSYGYMDDLNNNVRFVNAGAHLAQMFAQLEPGTEPIGTARGFVPAIRTRPLANNRTLSNDLAEARVTMLSRDNVIRTLSTAAHPRSDYTKLSTIISSNEILRRIRSEASSIVGSAFTDSEISNLDTRMLGLSRALVNAGYAQDCNISLNASRTDRINGVLNVDVTFVPPFSIRAINVSLVLDAPAGF